ncbi:MAG: glycosyltransferase family 39 protein [bacterium]|nr:glycosyltransferase family 39 protein [bacterium]
MPYVGYNAWNFNIYALIAQNYNRFGFLHTHFAPVISVAQTLPVQPEYYLNHPPLLSVLVALVFRIIGESFLSGRFVNISVSFFSCLLLFFIAKDLKGGRYALIVFIVSALLPASVLFGRMIGQESLVLFFALSGVLAFLEFEKKKKKWIFFIAVLTIILGTLTDWAMVYFTASFSIFLFRLRKGLLALIVTGVSILTAISYVGFVYLTSGDVSFLLSGFFNRSTGGLVLKQNFGIIWMSTIATRILIYFNPIFSALALLFALKYRRATSKKLSFLIGSLFLFGLIHISLYPEGSYGHPYWLYYLFPSIVLASSVVIESVFEKRRWIVYCLIVFSVVYTLSVIHWKTKEVAGNIFRYQLAEVASTHFIPFQTITLNRDGVIDPDIFQYSFHHPTSIFESGDVPEEGEFSSGSVISCIASCGEKKLIKVLKKNHSAVRYIGKDVEMWVFQGQETTSQSVVTTKIAISLPKPSQSFFSHLYRTILQLTTAPQL